MVVRSVYNCCCHLRIVQSSETGWFGGRILRQGVRRAGWRDKGLDGGTRSCFLIVFFFLFGDTEFEGLFGAKGFDDKWCWGWMGWMVTTNFFIFFVLFGDTRFKILIGDKGCDDKRTLKGRTSWTGRDSKECSESEIAVAFLLFFLFGDDAMGWRFERLFDYNRLLLFLRVPSIVASDADKCVCQLFCCE